MASSQENNQDSNTNTNQPTTNEVTSNNEALFYRRPRLPTEDQFPSQWEPANVSRAQYASLSRQYIAARDRERDATLRSGLVVLANQALEQNKTNLEKRQRFLEQRKKDLQQERDVFQTEASRLRRVCCVLACLTAGLLLALLAA